MSLAIEPIGAWQVFAAKLTTTNATAVYTAPTNGKGAILNAMKLCNVDGTAPVDVTIAYYRLSDTTAFALASTYALAQDTYHDFDLMGLRMKPGDELRVTAGAANDLEVVGTYKGTLMILKHGLAALLIVLGATTAHAFDKPPERYKGIPNPIRIFAVPERTAHDFCRHFVKQKLNRGARILGCMLNAKPCVIVVSKGQHFAALIIHEAAHCNGWPGSHPR